MLPLTFTLCNSSSAAVQFSRVTRTGSGQKSYITNSMQHRHSGSLSCSRIFPTLHGIRKFISVFIRARNKSLYWARRIQSPQTHTLFL